MAVSNALAEILACETEDIGFDSQATLPDGTAVVVFPVYCQNIPAPVMGFLTNLRAKYIVLIATYGKISYGNVLFEAQKLVNGEIIAGAYIPMGHSFLDGDCDFDKEKLLPLADRIRTPRPVRLPRTRKNPLANLFPALRSQIGVKLTKTDRCHNCGLCDRVCPMGAIQNGKPGPNCIRCLRCVTHCPQKALQTQNSPVLQKYLHSYYKEDYIFYL